MLLFSAPYFVFLVCVFFLYWPLARYRAAGRSVLLLANYFFYAKWHLFYLALIPVASTIDFLIGLGLAKDHSPRKRRWLVTASVALNVGILATFKYLPAIDERWDWAFSLGISFYTFQALSYTIDLYRRDAKPTRSLLSYLASVSFFPAILAGPITRPAQLIPQMENEERTVEGGRAFFLIGLGLIKKLLIADYLAENLVNRVFDLPKLYSGFETLIAVYAYALQLYYDFSGYTDIALGSALLLGLRLTPNFNRPYSAQNIADFWRRWHISLSNWLRDYVFFSLPGHRSRLVYASLVITMFIGGLWHGATWNFIIWGLLHGCGLASTRAIQAWRGNPKPRAEWWARLGRGLVTFHFVCFGWVFFRAATLEGAVDVLARIGSSTVSTANLPAGFTVVLAIAAATHFTPARVYDRSLQWFSASPPYVQAAAMALIVLAIEYVGETGSAPFIYSRF